MAAEGKSRLPTLDTTPDNSETGPIPPTSAPRPGAYSAPSRSSLGSNPLSLSPRAMAEIPTDLSTCLASLTSVITAAHQAAHQNDAHFIIDLSDFLARFSPDKLAALALRDRLKLEAFLQPYKQIQRLRDDPHSPLHVSAPHITPQTIAMGINTAAGFLKWVGKRNPLYFRQVLDQQREFARFLAKLSFKGKKYEDDEINIPSKILDRHKAYQASLANLKPLIAYFEKNKSVADKGNLRLLNSEYRNISNTFSELRDLTEIKAEQTVNIAALNEELVIQCFKESLQKIITDEIERCEAALTKKFDAITQARLTALRSHQTNLTNLKNIEEVHRLVRAIQADDALTETRAANTAIRTPSAFLNAIDSLYKDFVGYFKSKKVATQTKNLENLLREAYQTEATFMLAMAELIDALSLEQLPELTLSDRLKIACFLEPYQKLLNEYLYREQHHLPKPIAIQDNESPQKKSMGKIVDLLAKQAEQLKKPDALTIEPTLSAGKLAVQKFLKWIESRNFKPFEQGAAQYSEFDSFMKSLPDKTLRTVKRKLARTTNTGIAPDDYSSRAITIVQRYPRYQLFLAEVGRYTEFASKYTETELFTSSSDIDKQQNNAATQELKAAHSSSRETVAERGKAINTTTPKDKKGVAEKLIDRVIGNKGPQVDITCLDIRLAIFCVQTAIIDLFDTEIDALQLSPSALSEDEEKRKEEQTQKDTTERDLKLKLLKKHRANLIIRSKTMGELNSFLDMLQKDKSLVEKPGFLATKLSSFGEKLKNLREQIDDYIKQRADGLREKKESSQPILLRGLTQDIDATPSPVRERVRPRRHYTALPAVFRDDDDEDVASSNSTSSFSSSASFEETEPKPATASSEPLPTSSNPDDSRTEKNKLEETKKAYDENVISSNSTSLSSFSSSASSKEDESKRVVAFSEPPPAGSSSGDSKVEKGTEAYGKDVTSSNSISTSSLFGSFKEEEGFKHAIIAASQSSPAQNSTNDSKIETDDGKNAISSSSTASPSLSISNNTSDAKTETDKVREAYKSDKAKPTQKQHIWTSLYFYIGRPLLSMSPFLALSFAIIYGFSNLAKSSFAIWSITPLSIFIIGATLAVILSMIMRTRRSVLEIPPCKAIEATLEIQKILRCRQEAQPSQPILDKALLSHVQTLKELLAPAPYGSWRPSFVAYSAEGSPNYINTDQVDNDYALLVEVQNSLIKGEDPFIDTPNQFDSEESKRRKFEAIILRMQKAQFDPSYRPPLFPETNPPRNKASTFALTFLPPLIPILSLVFSLLAFSHVFIPGSSWMSTLSAYGAMLLSTILFAFSWVSTRFLRRNSSGGNYIELAILFGVATVISSILLATWEKSSIFAAYLSPTGLILAIATFAVAFLISTYLAGERAKKKPGVLPSDKITNGLVISFKVLKLFGYLALAFLTLCTAFGVVLNGLDIQGFAKEAIAKIIGGPVSAENLGWLKTFCALIFGFANAAAFETIKSIGLKSPTSCADYQKQKASWDNAFTVLKIIFTFGLPLTVWVIQSSFPLGAKLTLIPAFGCASILAIIFSNQLQISWPFKKFKDAVANLSQKLKIFLGTEPLKGSVWWDIEREFAIGSFLLVLAYPISHYLGVFYFSSDMLAVFGIIAGTMGARSYKIIANYRDPAIITRSYLPPEGSEAEAQKLTTEISLESRTSPSRPNQTSILNTSFLAMPVPLASPYNTPATTATTENSEIKSNSSSSKPPRIRRATPLAPFANLGHIKTLASARIRPDNLIPLSPAAAHIRPIRAASASTSPPVPQPPLAPIGPSILMPKPRATGNTAHPIIVPNITPAPANH